MNILILLAIIVIFVSLYKFITNLKKYPPGPIPIPFIGNILQVDREAPHKTIADWSKKYGPVFTFWIGNDPNVTINDYNLLKEYVVRKGEIFVGRPSNYVFDLFTNGYGIGFTEGETWKEQRRFALHALRDIGFGKNVMEIKIQEQIDSLMLSIEDIFQSQGGAKQAVFDPYRPVQLAIGNIILSVVFGLKYKKGDQTLQKLLDGMESNQNTLMKPMSQLLTVYPILGNIPLFNHFNKDKFVEVGEMFRQWAADRIEEHKAIFNKEDEPTDFVQAFLKEMDARKSRGEDLGTYSEQQLIGVVLDLYGAGQDTTVTTLRWAMLFLIHNPQVQARVQEEIDSVVGKYGLVKMQHRGTMPYTAATINEVMRLANILPINLPHKNTQDITIAGYFIPAGTTVVPQMASVHIDADMFTDPEVFNPDRFINSTDSIKDKAEYVIPFSVGKRACPGESLARMEMFMILCSLLQKFSIQPAQPGCLPSLKGDFKFMNMPKPFECVFVKR